MATTTIGVPKIEFTVQSAASAVATRLKNGIVAIILQDDTATAGLYTVADEQDLPSGLSETNKAYVLQALMGSRGSQPAQVILSVIGSDDDLVDDGAAPLAITDCDYIAGPPTMNATAAEEVETWLETARKGYFIGKLVAADFAADNMAVVNFVATGIVAGGTTYTGLAADLRADGARADIDTSYLATGTESRDFAYTVRHRGRKTVSNILANGVLAGTSSKVLRGTIDLVHGCKGSEGTERETVLIASEGVDNKTVPTILCDEDDVAGNHGATIGHVRPDQLFYMMSRGISPEAAEALFLTAKLEDAALTAPTEGARAAVARLAERIAPDFDIDEADEEEAA